jgi:hypothetical protein
MSTQSADAEQRADAPAVLARLVTTAMALLTDLDVSSYHEESALAAITSLERLKRAAAASQARLSVRADELARRRQRDEGVSVERIGAGVAAQIALARLESPHRGGRDLGLAKALVHELPQTLVGMGTGGVSEWQATLVARETACLDPDTRRAIDERIAERLPGWGDAQTAREVRKLAYAADPRATLARHARAESDRRVTIRPAPDTMCYLTAHLPATAGVAAYSALIREADESRARGDSRGKGQVMADTLVQRLTGQATAPDVPLEVEVVMPVDTLLGDGPSPAHLVGYGPLPAARPDGSCETTGPRPGFAGSSPDPSPASWWRWTAGVGGSRVSSGTWWCCATSSAGLRGVTPRSATSTTRSPTARAGPPVPTTPKGCARPATTRRRHPAGVPGWPAAPEATWSP